MYVIKISHCKLYVTCKTYKNLTQPMMVTKIEHKIVTHSVNYNDISCVCYVRELNI